VDLAALTLFGRARYRVLACLLALEPAQSLHLREIARRAGLSPTAAQYELRRLELAGLVLRAGAPARPLYAFNGRHAVAPELRSMIGKLDAARAPQAIEDDAFWAGKRKAQARDYASRSLGRKSVFLADRALARAFRADLRKDVSYDD
jgi:DNA-binding Lrp family transcriptional regulator